MLRYSAVVVALSSLGLLSLSPACGSNDAQPAGSAGGGGGGGTTDLTDLRSLYATAVCANIVPCCHGIGRDVTEAKCVATVTAEFGDVDYAFGAFNVPTLPVAISDSPVDPVVAASCAQAAAVAVRACPLTYAAAGQATIDTLVACQAVYGGHGAAGATCAHAGDCAPAQGPGGVSACLDHTCSDFTYGVAEAGEACDITFDACDLDASLSCSASGVCTTGLAVGAFCCQPQAGGVDCNSDTELACAAGGFCDSNIEDSTFGYCTAGTQVGDACHGSCDAPQACVAGFCVAPKKGGDPCTADDNCIGGSCERGTCVSEFADALWVHLCQ